MKLISLLTQNGLALIPENECIYDKSSDEYIPKDQNINIITPVPNIHPDYVHLIHKAKFGQHCLISNAVLANDIFFMYGKNPQGKELYLGFVAQHGSLHNIYSLGLMLNDGRLITCGEITIPGISPEEHTINLFRNSREWIKIPFRTNSSCTYRFDFFNMSGEVFHREYSTTHLDHIIVDPVSNENVFIMRF
ncbi:hypothetical protein [Ehrlichia chaffeensis]|uniref:hypothetical protein n=1 Tax=Ehrlichia chaffeensis TaxID=945 RepID=UPI000444AD9A|nr:hypothetical protein [Ehrlichia chaffeensis]AHX08899.1 hypothetical protein ECHSTV_0563 [Ehrlichia chaffeensis str. Saint Vincent]